MAGTRNAPQPTGKCWCGCNKDVPPDSFFIAGHDLRAAARVIKLEFGDTASFLDTYGYSPDGENSGKLNPAS